LNSQVWTELQLLQDSNRYHTTSLLRCAVNFFRRCVTFSQACRKNVQKAEQFY